MEWFLIFTIMILSKEEFTIYSTTPNPSLKRVPPTQIVDQFFFTYVEISKSPHKRGAPSLQTNYWPMLICLFWHLNGPILSLLQHRLWMPPKKYDHLSNQLMKSHKKWEKKEKIHPKKIYVYHKNQTWK